MDAFFELILTSNVAVDFCIMTGSLCSLLIFTTSTYKQHNAMSPAEIQSNQSINQSVNFYSCLSDRRTTKVLVSTTVAVRTFSSVSWRTGVLLPWRRAPVKSSRSGGRQPEKLGCRQLTVWQMAQPSDWWQPTAEPGDKYNDAVLSQRWPCDAPYINRL